MCLPDSVGRRRPLVIVVSKQSRRQFRAADEDRPIEWARDRKACLVHDAKKFVIAKIRS